MTYNASAQLRAPSARPDAEYAPVPSRAQSYARHPPVSCSDTLCRPSADVRLGLLPDSVTVVHDRERQREGEPSGREYGEHARVSPPCVRGAKLSHYRTAVDSEVLPVTYLVPAFAIGREQGDEPDESVRHEPNAYAGESPGKGYQLVVARARARKKIAPAT